MSARALRLGALALALVLLVPITAPARMPDRHDHRLTRISGASPFEEGCNAPFDEGYTGERTHGAEIEISLSVDPNDPHRMVAAWIQDAYAGIGTAVTHDGGRTWTNGVVPDLSVCSGAPFFLTADPWLSTGPDSTIYLATMSFADRGFHTHVSTSTDGGLTWSPPTAVVPGAGASHDKPSITADPNQACVAHADWMEMGTFAGPEIGLAHSRTEDCGATWSVPVPLALTGGDPANPTSLYNPEVHVLPDGVLLALWFASPIMEDDTVPHRIEVARSTDGGRSWSAPTVAAEYVPGNQAEDPETGAPIKTHYPWPSSDVAPDGSLHITFHHLRADGLEEIRAVRTADGGRSWSAPSIVTTDPDARPFLPIIAAAGDGTLAVTWYDMHADVLGDDSLTTEVRMAFSNDGGDSWRERRLSGPFDMRSAMNKLEPSVGLWLGDYHGLDGLPRGFAAAFGLSAPTAVHGANDVFFTRIRTPRGTTGG